MDKNQIQTTATLTCPECGTKEVVQMPTNGHQHYFKCANETCNADVATKEGECCVFCSYADIPCPEKQMHPDTNLPHSLI